MYDRDVIAGHLAVAEKYLRTARREVMRGELVAAQTEIGNGFARSSLAARMLSAEIQSPEYWCSETEDTAHA